MKLGGKRSGRQRLIFGLLVTLFLLSAFSQLGPQLSNLPNLPKIIAPSLPVGIRNDFNQIAKVVEPIFAGIPKLDWWTTSSAQTYGSIGESACSSATTGDYCSSGLVSKTVAAGGTVTTGDTLVLELDSIGGSYSSGCTGTSISDTESNSWTYAGSASGLSNEFDVDFYAVAKSTSASLTVTIASSCYSLMGSSPNGAGGYSLWDFSGVGTFNTDYNGNAECAFSGSTTSAVCYGGIGTSTGGGTTENPAGDTVMATEEQSQDRQNSCSSPGWTPSEGPGCAVWSYGSSCSHSCASEMWGWTGDWSGGANSFELECNYLGSGSVYCTQVYYGENVLVFNPPSVTQPIACTMASGASAATITLSGGSISPTTDVCDGTERDFTVNPSTTITATEPAVGTCGTDCQDVFASSATTVMVTSSATEWTITNYEQFTNTYESVDGSSPTDWTASISFEITGTVAGVSSYNFCNSNPGSGTTSTSTCSGYTDYDQTTTIPATNSGTQPSNGRWRASAAVTQTITSGGNSYSATYYEQFTNTFVIGAVKQGSNDFDNAMTLAVSGYYYGSASQTICTITTTVASSDSCSGYSDTGQVVTYAQFLTSPPSNTRWQNAAGSSSNSGTITSGGNTESTVSYYSQLTNTYEVVAEAQPDFDTGMSWTVTGTVLGTGSSTVCTISSTVASSDSCTGYADYDLAVTIPQAATSPPSGTRWYSTAACSSTLTTGSNTETCNSYKQLDNTYDAVPNQRTTFDGIYSITVSGTYFGSSSQTICTITTSNGGGTVGCTGYSDYDLLVTVGAITGAPSNTRWVIVGTSTFTDTTGSNTHSVEYYNEIQNTYQVTAEAQTDFDNGMSWVVTGTLGGTPASTICTISSTVAATDSCSGYADYDQPVTIPQAASSPPSNSRWYSTAACSSTLTTPTNTENCNSYKQWTNTYEMAVAGSVSGFTIGSGSGESMVVLGYLYGSSGQTICTATASSGASATCSGYSDNVEASTLPQFLTGEAANTQWQNSNGGSQSSGSITSGANTFTADFYLQLSNTYQASTNGQGPPDWDSGLSATATGTLLGVTGQSICTISPSYGTTTTAGCSGYADYDQPVSEPATMSGAGSDIQWKLYGTSSWTDTTAVNTHTGTYYKQLQNTYQESANAQADFDNGLSWSVTGTIGGVGSSSVCSISSTVAATDSCSGYADYDLGVTIPQAASGAGANTRWQSSAACTFTQTTGGNINNCNAYKQLTNTYAANPVAPSTFSASITFAVTGSLYGVTGQAICTVTVTGSPSSGSYNCSGYADYDAAVSIASAASGSPANQRWEVSGTNSWTDTTGANTHTANYYLQDSTTVSYSIIGGAGASSAPTLTYTYLGASGTTYSMTTSPTVVWQDDGQGWTSTNPLTGSGASERWDATSGTSGTSSAAETIAPAYYDQFNVTVTITSIDGSIPGPSDPTFSCMQFGSPATLSVATSQATWVDNSSAWSITNPISISSTERFDSPSTISGTVSSSTTFSITYYHQYENGFSYSIVGSSTRSSPPTFKFFYEGSVNSTTLSTSSASLWLDASPAVWNSTNPLTGSNATVEWLTDTPTGSTSSAGTTNIVYNLYHLVITLLNPEALTIKFTNTTGSFTSTGSALSLSDNSTFTVVGSNFNGLYEMVTNGSTIYQVPKNFGNGMQVFSSVGLNTFNFTAGGGQQFLNMTGTSAMVIVLDPVPATGLSYTSTTVAGSPYTPTFSQSKTVIQVTTTGTQNILMYFVGGVTTQTQCVGPSCGGGGETTATTTSSTITVTGPGVTGGGNTFVENGQVNIESGSPSSQTISLVLDNIGSSSITELTQLSFSNMSNVKASFNPSELPINVGSGATGSLPVQLQYSSLAPGTYVINGTATFTQYSSQTNSYVTLHSGFKITLFVQALTTKGGTPFNFLALLTAYWWAFIGTAILVVVGIGLVIRKTGR